MQTNKACNYMNLRGEAYQKFETQTFCECYQQWCLQAWNTFLETVYL